MPPREKSPDIELVDGVPVFTVSSFNAEMKGLMRTLFPDGIWIEGEIEGMKDRPHATGHYFSLIDGEGKSKVKVDVKLFSNSGDLARVTAKLDRADIGMDNGLRMRFFCTVDFYAQRGEISLIIKDVDTQFTLGDIAARREALVKKLVDAGLDRKNGMLALPRVPLRLGIVSSSQAAGYIDALTHLRESGLGFTILLADVNVMGEQAVAQVSAAIDAFSRRNDIDLVLVMRGGGSRSDLATFDDERIAMAIVGCRHPVFTGIGHEIDTSVADIVAHTRCKTPTACADEVIGLVVGFLDELASAADTLAVRTSAAVQRGRSRIALCSERLRTRPRAAIVRERNRADVAARTVRLLDPVHVLARGWSITRNARGEVVRSVADTAPGERIVTLLADGEVRSTVDSTEGKA